MRKLTKDELIEQFKSVHGDKYDYSKINYVNKHTAVDIVCHEHGVFKQLPSSHLKGNGCPMCSHNKRIAPYDDVLRRMKEVHDGKYTYDETTYQGTHKKMRMICPKHGEFWLKPNSVLTEKRGCKKCNGGVKLTTDEFIEKGRRVHANKYDYSKVEYVNAFTPVVIICKLHGEFKQKPGSHLFGMGCPICGGSLKLDTDAFIKRSKEVHGDKYDYSKSEYINNRTKVCIICPEHGEFWQNSGHHMNGVGCPLCKESHLERRTHLILNGLNILHERQKRFDWLGMQSLDFYLPNYNVAIECQGIQHYKPVDFSLKKDKEIGNAALKYVKELDKRKAVLCEENGVHLEYINYDEDVESRVKEIIKKYNI